MKGRTVIFTPEAEDDLQALYVRTANVAGPVIAFNYLSRIEAFIRRLDLFPERGRTRDEVRAGLRVIGFERRVSIAFTVRPETVVILRLFPRGKEWERVFR